MVKNLIEAGANVNFAQPFFFWNPDMEGMTALIIASQIGYKEVVRVLASAGANVNHFR